MRCEEIREAWSAQLDGECSDVEPQTVAAHVRSCSACNAWTVAASELHRHTRVRVADSVPDRTDAIMAAVRGDLRHRATQARRGNGTYRRGANWARPALLVAACTQLALALPELLLGSSHGGGVHLAHEQGGWDIALAIALLAVVWVPAWAPGLLPFLGALALVLVGTAVVDVAGGRAPAIGELHHVLDLASILFVWLLTPPASRRAGPALPHVAHPMRPVAR